MATIPPSITVAIEDALDQTNAAGYSLGRSDQTNDDRAIIAAAAQAAADAETARAAIQAQYEDYVAHHHRLDDPVPPPPPPPIDLPTIMGMNFIHGTRQTAYEKRAQVGRVYAPAGCTDLMALEEFAAGVTLGIKDWIVSWKDTATTTLGRMLDSRPADCTVYGTAHHEPENDMLAKDWQTIQAIHLPIVRAHGCIPMPILMQYTLDPHSGRVPDDWMLPPGLADVQGFDFYPTTLAYQAAGLTRIKAFTAKAGLSRYGFGEYGVALSNPTLGVQLVKDFRAKTADAELAAYWSQRDKVTASKPNPVDYHFSPSVADAWFAPAV